MTCSDCKPRLILSCYLKTSPIPRPHLLIFLANALSRSGCKAGECEAKGMSLVKECITNHVKLFLAFPSNYLILKTVNKKTRKSWRIDNQPEAIAVYSALCKTSHQDAAVTRAMFGGDVGCEGGRDQGGNPVAEAAVYSLLKFFWEESGRMTTGLDTLTMSQIARIESLAGDLFHSESDPALHSALDKEVAKVGLPKWGCQGGKPGMVPWGKSELARLGDVMRIARDRLPVAGISSVESVHQAIGCQVVLGLPLRQEIKDGLATIE